MPKIRVFADTNVILESFRTGCWTAISNHFAIETVEKCVEETLTGNPGEPTSRCGSASRPECGSCCATFGHPHGTRHLGSEQPSVQHARRW